MRASIILANLKIDCGIASPIFSKPEIFILSHANADRLIKRKKTMRQNLELNTRSGRIAL